MLSAIIGKNRFGVLEPGTFRVLLRMVLKRAVAQMTGIAAIRGCLRSTVTGQTTVTVDSEKGFGKHILGSCQKTRRCKPSLKRRQKPCGLID